MSRRICYPVSVTSIGLGFTFHLANHYAFTEKEINIYVGLTDMQRKWYRSVLEKDIDAVNGGKIGALTIDHLFIHSSRPFWKERGKDSTHEHRHAGKDEHFIQLSLCIIDNNP